MKTYTIFTYIFIVLYWWSLLGIRFKQIVALLNLFSERNLIKSIQILIKCKMSWHPKLLLKKLRTMKLLFGALILVPYLQRKELERHLPNNTIMCVVPTLLSKNIYNINNTTKKILDSLANHQPSKYQVWSISERLLLLY